jgi:hypothetical protein
MAIQTYQLVAGDWIGLERIINDLTGRVLGQTMGPASTPVFSGLKLAGPLLFTDAAYNIGASGATRPKNIFLSGYIKAGGAVETETGFKCGGTGAVADGTYTVGLKLTGGGNNGTITTKGGIITAITPAT